MHFVLVYDISDDRIRTKIADVCLDYGLDRFQWSAFVGDISRTQASELMEKATRTLGKEFGRIQLIPICDRDWQSRVVVDRMTVVRSSEETGAQPATMEAVASVNEPESAAGRIRPEVPALDDWLTEGS